MYSKQWSRDDPRQRLTDILKAIERIQRYVHDINFETFCKDEMRQEAVIRALLVVSEATRNLPESMLERYPEIAWREIKGLGNVYRHDYGKLDEATVWNTATATDLSELQKVLQEELGNA